jgi:hypothetical protein
MIRTGRLNSLSPPGWWLPKVSGHPDSGRLDFTSGGSCPTRHAGPIAEFRRLVYSTALTRNIPKSELVLSRPVGSNSFGLGITGLLTIHSCCDLAHFLKKWFWLKLILV